MADSDSATKRVLGRPSRLVCALVFVLLLAAWLVVAVRTLHDGARGRLFLPMGAPAAEVEPRSVR